MRWMRLEAFGERRMRFLADDFERHGPHGWLVINRSVSVKRSDVSSPAWFPLERALSVQSAHLQTASSRRVAPVSRHKLCQEARSSSRGELLPYELPAGAGLEIPSPVRGPQGLPQPRFPFGNAREFVLESLEMLRITLLHFALLFLAFHGEHACSARAIIRLSYGCQLFPDTLEVQSSDAVCFSASFRPSRCLRTI